MAHTLIVEDEKNAREALARLIRLDGDTVEAAGSLAEARTLLETNDFDLVLLDLTLPDGDGTELVPELAERPHTDVVMITGNATVETAVEALRAGAVDYLTKPIDTARLEGVLARARSTSALRRERDELRGELRRLGRFGEMVGGSSAMQTLYDLIGRVAPTDASVFVVGPTGVGKELVASMVHRLSRRASRPFEALNCAAVPATLIESQLFGHEKGAFTGADRKHRGVFERADGGTLFLDEITEMPIELQPKLLRVLESSTYHRLGAEESHRIDVRVIAATNRDPQQCVADGTLREDLLYRLNVFPIAVPPLRERLDDVELLARTFLARQNEAAERDVRFSDAALERLRAHGWPGNVRELKNVVERAFILTSGDRIDVEHLPLEPRAASAAGARTDGDGVFLPAGTSIADAEQELILNTLKRTGGARRQAARILGISPKTLYNRLRKYEEDGIEVP